MDWSGSALKQMSKRPLDDLDKVTIKAAHGKVSMSDDVEIIIK